MKQFLARLVSPSVSVIASVVIIAFVYGGCALTGGINMNKNVARVTVNSSVATGNYQGTVVNFNDPATAATNGSASDTSAPMDVTVVVTAAGFTPAVVTVAVGGTVTWMNENDELHQPDADDASARDGFSASAAIARDERFRYTFPASGTIAYHDDRHPELHGTVIVK